MNENEAKNGTNELIERIVDALEADASPEWNPAPSWADYVLTWEGLRRLANDLLGRRPYDGRNPLAEPVLRGFLESALNGEGYVVLDAPTAPGRYGPMCSDCWRDKSRHPRWAGRATKMNGPVNCMVCGGPTPGRFNLFGLDEGIDIFEW